MFLRKIKLLGKKWFIALVSGPGIEDNSVFTETGGLTQEIKNYPGGVGIPPV